MKTLKSRTDWIDALVALSTSPARTKEEIRKWYKMAVSLGRVKLEEQIEVPAIIWHYLADLDIRAKDPEYGRWQTAEFQKAIETMRRAPGGSAGSR